MEIRRTVAPGLGRLTTINSFTLELPAFYGVSFARACRSPRCPRTAQQATDLVESSEGVGMRRHLGFRWSRDDRQDGGPRPHPQPYGPRTACHSTASGWSHGHCDNLHRLRRGRLFEIAVERPDVAGPAAFGALPQPAHQRAERVGGARFPPRGSQSARTTRRANPRGRL